MNLYNLLNETGVPVDRAAFASLNESKKADVSDEVLVSMFKFISDKYNSLDFSEIEKSAGDYSRFKYRDVLDENIDILKTIYTTSTDAGAAKYLEVCDSCATVIEHLKFKRTVYSDLYKAGNGMVQLLYTSQVAAIIYAIGTMISNTIRMVTVDTEVDCEVIFDEIPGTVKHVHIKNINAAAASVDDINALLSQYSRKSTMTESISLTAGLMIGAGIIILLPRLLVLVREIIYSIYYTRVRVAEMIGIEVDLINTNIEGLTKSGKNAKVIAKQRKIAAKLTKWQNTIALKMDTTNTLTVSERNKDNKKLAVTKESEIVRSTASFSSGDILI